MFLNRECREFNSLEPIILFINEIFKQENVHIFIFLAILWYFIYARPYLAATV